MVYNYQTFNSGNIYTDGQAQQIEDNVRDHLHGASGVGPSGLSWDVTSKGTAFGVSSSDVGTLFKVYGVTTVSFDDAATLGSNFGAGFINAGSQRVVLQAAAGQWIHDNSIYALTPGEGLTVHSDGIELSVLGGNPNAPARLGRAVCASVGLTDQLSIRDTFPSDFESYELIVHANVQTVCQLMVRVGQTSASVTANSYINTLSASTDAGQIFNVTVNSQSGLLARMRFRNVDTSIGLYVEGHSVRQTAIGTWVRDEFAWGQVAPGPYNYFQLISTPGVMGSGACMELWGYGRRPRRH